MKRPILGGTRNKRRTLAQLLTYAAELGFQPTACVHEDTPPHIVYDWPRPLVDAHSGPFLRLHVRAKRHNDGSTRSVIHVAGAYPHPGGAVTTIYAAYWMAVAIDALSCHACRRPYDPADTSMAGGAQYSGTYWCRRCVDACHGNETADHRCPVCA